jgi:hypothetical protein
LLNANETTVKVGKLKANITNVLNALKIIRVLRLTRLVRIMKLRKQKENIDEIMEKEQFLKNSDASKYNEMKISKKIKYIILRRVIILVLMIFRIIIFNQSVYYNTVDSTEFGMIMFKKFENL